MWCRKIAFLSLLLLAPPACDGTGRGSQGVACSPFEPVYESVTITDEALVLQADDGTLYVLDQNPDEEVLSAERMFVLRDGKLKRIHVPSAHWRLPLKPGNSGQAWWHEGDLAQELRVARDDDGTITASYCVAHISQIKDGNDDEDCVGLVSVGHEAIADLEVENLPSELTVEFVAKASSGTTFVGVRPARDFTEQSYRVFAGFPGAMEELEVIEVVRSLCNSVDYSVVYQGKEQRLHIDRECYDGNGCGQGDIADEVPGCYMESGSKITMLELLDIGPTWGESDAYDVADFLFFCR